MLVLVLVLFSLEAFCLSVCLSVPCVVLELVVVVRDFLFFLLPGSSWLWDIDEEEKD